MQEPLLEEFELLPGIQERKKEEAQYWQELDKRGIQEKFKTLALIEGQEEQVGISHYYSYTNPQAQQ